jgi:hypothetical protein
MTEFNDVLITKYTNWKPDLLNKSHIKLKTEVPTRVTTAKRCCPH